MGDDLKTTLGKVASSAGRKTYAFGYLAGKRKDKKGEGSLDVIPGRKAFKKEDLADDLESPGAMYQGKCWGDSTGMIVFFSGKSLTDAIVDKMKIMVGKSTGKTFDFQLPDEVEEKRHDTLESVELAAERNVTGDGGGPTPASPETASASGTKDAPIPPAPPIAQPKPAQPKTQKPAVDPAAKSYEALLASMQEPLELLEATSPADAAKIKQIIDAAAKYAKPGEYAKAVGFLKEAAKLLAAAAPSPSAARAAEVQPAKADEADNPSLAQLAKARLAWLAARDAARQNVRRLQDALRKKYQNVPEEQATLTSALQELGSVDAELDTGLGEQLDQVINAEGETRLALVREARATLADHIQFLETDKLIQLADGNEVLPDMQVRAPLLARLLEIKAVLA